MGGNQNPIVADLEYNQQKGLSTVHSGADLEYANFFPLIRHQHRNKVENLKRPLLAD